ncbi:MAG: glycyl-radical enzyme activating protein [Actinobacteria bacterium]|nr:glycyl-radical enzyme activating protein [Actinomycetota bacterium]
MKSVKGTVSDIQRFSVHDGPGIRTLVFLKGCNLRCRWCSNPETQKYETELFFQPSKCIGDMACVDKCPHAAIEIQIKDRKREVYFDRKLCRNCGKCAEVCCSKARIMKGYQSSADEVFQVILKDKEFYANSGGGVTIGGGEPLIQADFVAAIFKRCKENGINTGIETAGYIPWEQIKKVILYTDFYLYDLKHMDPKKHLAYIGKDNYLIIKNLQKLVHMKKNIIIRTPVIPGFNNTVSELNSIANHIRLLGLKEWNLLPYNDLGRGKYKLLGREYPMKNDKSLQKEDLEELTRQLDTEGILVKIGG